jgi:hypothetical protein
MKVEWHSTMKEIAPVSVVVIALVEVADKHRAMAVEAETMIKDAAVVTHDQLRQV